MGLSGQQRKKLQNALLDAFPEKASLERILDYELDKNLAEIVRDSNLEDIVFNLIKKANSENWIQDLVRAAHRSNPGNESLKNIAEELLIGSGGISFKQQQKNRRDLLEEVEFEVTSRLESSLHNAVWINLRKESQPQQVKRPWDAEIKIGSKPAESFPNSTTTLEVFDRKDIAGRLLILGNPGAGKTTTMLDLAQSLVTRSGERPDYPISVLLNLSSWKDKDQKFIDWLLIELKSKYGVPKKVGQEWLQNRQLLPLLDGLDEVKSELQESCINSINQFLQEYRPHHVVVCSRIEEYSNLSTKLLLNGAIYLQPLTNNQIYDYLNEANCTDLRQTINHDSNLLELVRTPLLLSISILAFQEISIDSWQQLSSTTDRIQHLLDAYVIRMLNRDINSKAYGNKKLPNNKQTRLWLVWLAKQLQRESKTEFLIEEMQPYWLFNKSQIIHYGLIYGLNYGLISGLLGLNFGLPGLIPGVLGLIYGLISGWEIKLQEKIIFLKINEWIINIIWRLGAIPGVIFWFFGTFIFGVPASAASLFLAIILGGIFGVIIGLIVLIVLITVLLGLIPGLIFGLIFGLINVEPELDIETKKIPNQGIWRTMIIGLNFGVISGVIIGVISGVISGVIIGVISGVISGVIIGLSVGGITCIQHFSLRLILYQNGYIPWNYARFLNYSTERLFLQRVGARYRFIHKMVQEHFANMEFNSN